MPKLPLFLTNDLAKTPRQDARGMAGLPAWMVPLVVEATQLLAQARTEAKAGNHAKAELLRDRAEVIFDELEAGRSGQPKVLTPPDRPSLQNHGCPCG